MDSFLEKWKRNDGLHLMTLIVFGAIILFITYTMNVLAGQDQSLPENPLKTSVEDYSQVPLSDGNLDLIDIDQKNKDDSKDPDEPVDDDEEHTLDTKDSSTSESTQQELVHMDASNPESTPGETGVGDAEGTGVGDGNGENPQSIKITDPDEAGEIVNHYFTTSITNGETVASEHYTFYIQQLDHPYTVKDIVVQINSGTDGVDRISDEWNPLATVDLTLAEGRNQITVGVVYEDENENTFTVYRNYVVYLDEKAIVIDTDLTNGEVYAETLHFRARAFLGDRELPLDVRVNDDVIEELEDGQYEVELQEGENVITLEAEHEGSRAKEAYTVIYHQPNLTIETDLENKTVNLADFSFQATAYDGDERVGLKILHNGRTITENERGQYSVTLTEGDNVFELTASKGEITHTETYNVFYSPTVGGGEEKEDDEFAPTITVYDIEHGETIRNATRTFHVKATSYKGTTLTGGNGVVTASNNGNPIDISWNDSSKISFTLKLVNGENNIVIIAKDQEGNTATKELTVYGELVEEGEAIGTVTISLEATTIGLGYIIPPQEVEIYQGERASHVIDRLFREHGIDYHHTGSHENSFYLSWISRPGLVQNPAIPEDLLELLKRDFSRVDPEDYDPDSLGEFDFTEGSGWMYSVNGIYPNVGFSDYYFKDGDVVRIRFTLALGADIGGGMPGANYGKEW